MFLKYTRNIVDKVNLNSYLFQFQRELDQVVFEWNTHRIRRSRNARGPTGRPICLFELPENFNGTNCLVDVPEEVINAIQRDREVISEIPLCDDDVRTLCDCILWEEEYNKPNAYNVADAINLYCILRIEILNLLQQV